MKLLNIRLRNFGSYKDLYFDYTVDSPALISGVLGSGKSTLMDAPAWILYGTTAKNISASGAMSWGATENTEGSLVLEINPSETMHITRIRSSNTSQNDLYWMEGDFSEKKRGKNLIDTQKLLDVRLGLTSEDYTLSSYFHEFSPSGSFFTAKAKHRREFFENLVSLEFTSKLEKRLLVVKSESKKTMVDNQMKVNKQLGVVETLEKQIKDLETDKEAWEIKNKTSIEKVQYKIDHYQSHLEKKELGNKKRSDEFESAKYEKAVKVMTELKSIAAYSLFEQGKFDAHLMDMKVSLCLPEYSTKCDKCGSNNDKAQKRIEYVRSLEADKKDLDRLAAELERIIDTSNPYLSYVPDNSGLLECQQELEKLKTQSNPIVGTVAKIGVEFLRESVEHWSMLGCQEELEFKYRCLEQLQDLNSTLRANLVYQTVKTIEASTNDYLQRFFGGELGVQFEPNGEDDLTVIIRKNGYEAQYQQLSKGQRGLIKLCFAVSVMKAIPSKTAVKCETLFFDESLDGLSEDFKIMAFPLFQELGKDGSSIFVIDHSSELQNLFEVKYQVTNEGGYSNVESV